MSSTLPISMLGVWMSLVMTIGQHQVCGAECTSAFSAPRCSALSQLVYHRNSKIDHLVSPPKNCWRTNRPKRIFAGPAVKMDLLAVDVRPLHDRMYMRILLLLLTMLYAVEGFQSTILQLRGRYVALYPLKYNHVCCVTCVFIPCSVCMLINILHIIIINCLYNIILLY